MKLTTTSIVSIMRKASKSSKDGSGVALPPSRKLKIAHLISVIIRAHHQLIGDAWPEPSLKQFVHTT